MASRSGQSIVTTAVTLSVGVEGVERAAKGMQQVERTVQNSAKSMDLHTRKSRKGLQAMLELSRGAEDFSSQIGTQGLSGALRASANNISQFATILSPLAGVVAGLSVAIGGPLVSSLIKADDKTKSLVQSMKELKRARDLAAVGKGADQRVQDIRRQAKREQAPGFKTLQDANAAIEKIKADIATANKILNVRKGQVKSALRKIVGGDFERTNTNLLAEFGHEVFRQELGLGRTSTKELLRGARGPRVLVADRTKRGLQSGELNLSTFVDFLKAKGKDKEASTLQRALTEVSKSTKEVRALVRDGGAVNKRRNDFLIKAQRSSQTALRTASQVTLGLLGVGGFGGIGGGLATKQSEREAAREAKEFERQEREKARRATKISGLELDIKRRKLQERLTDARFAAGNAVGGRNTAVTSNQALEAMLSAARDLQKATAEQEVREIQEEMRDLQREQLRAAEELLRKLKVGTP